MGKEDTEWFGKTEWTKREIIEFLEEMREDLIVDKKLQYDAMIFVYCGHGGNGRMIASDGKKICVNVLHKKFSQVWKEKVETIPRLVIMDCFRSKASNASIRGKFKDLTFSDLKYILCCDAIGNMDSDDDSNDFSDIFIDCLLHNTKQKKAPFGMSDLVEFMKQELHRKTGRDDIVWTNRDPRIDSIVLKTTEHR